MEVEIETKTVLMRNESDDGRRRSERRLSLGDTQLARIWLLGSAFRSGCGRRPDCRHVGYADATTGLRKLHRSGR